MAQKEVSMRRVVFVVLPEVRGGDVGESWKGTEEGRILGRTRKKVKEKNLCSSLYERHEGNTCPRVTVLRKLKQKSPVGRDTFLFPSFIKKKKIKRMAGA